MSTDKEDQVNSFISQQVFFREYVGRNLEWELYDIYADEGVTGTSIEKRTQFNRMLFDARQGKFQMIITKEVSRFSRNILDTITYTRELKALGIGVFFMNDGLNTLDPDAELRLSIMGSIAQEESRKTSERVKWGQTRKMEQGVVFGRSMLGYDVTDGKLCINQEGAKLVKQIFYQYGVEKKGTTVIAKKLQESGAKTITGNPQWRESYILKILKNEKYAGDLIQKKTITPDYLTHAKKYNHGEEALVVIRDHHEPIIPRDLWDLVQKEILLRTRVKSSGCHSDRYLLSGKITCGECGSVFVARMKTGSNGTACRRWRCIKATREGREKKDDNGKICGCNVGRQIRDDLAIDMLRFVLSCFARERTKLLQNAVSLIEKTVVRGTALSESSTALIQKEETIKKKIEGTIDAYLSGVLTEEEMVHMKSNYSRELESLKQKLHDIEKRSQFCKTESVEQVENLLDGILSVNEDMSKTVRTLLEYMRIYKDGTVLVKLNHIDCIWRFRLIKGNQPQ